MRSKTSKMDYTDSFLPFWYVGQWTGPLLDKLDHNWSLADSCYNVTAKNLI